MVPLIAAAAVAAASSAAGSYFGADASKDAARMAVEQEQKGLDFQKEAWNKTQENMSPYMEAGKQGLAGYQSSIAGAKAPEYTYQNKDFNFSTYEDPGAQYQMQQATRALNNSSLAKGLGGGGALKAIMAKNQEMAGTAYQGAFNRYITKNQQDKTFADDQYKRQLEYQNLGINRQKDLMTQGASMASGLGQLGTTTGQQIGQSYGNIGSSLASGAAGAGNAINQGLTGFSNAIGKGIGAYYGAQQQQMPVTQTNDNLGVN